MIMIVYSAILWGKVLMCAHSDGGNIDLRPLVLAIATTGNY